MKTKERIEKEAVEAALNTDIDYEDEAMWAKGYIAGAKAERNKAIDECIAVLETYPGDMNIKPILEALKT